MKARTLAKGRTVRILEISPAWKEESWCKKEHVGYVLSGTMLLEFKSKGRKSLAVGKGQSFFVPLGVAHKASSRETTTAFVVDRAPDS